MNNKITTDETMSKMADATRLRTRQLLLFSQGYQKFFFSFIWLMLMGAVLSLLNYPARWSLTVGAACIVLFIAGIVIKMVDTSRRKKKLMMDAKTCHRSNEKRNRFSFVAIIFLGIGAYVLEQIVPSFFKNYYNSLFILFFLGILNLYSFFESRLPEELIASMFCFGISVASIAWHFQTDLFNFFAALAIGAFIQMLLGGIFWIRWQRFSKQVSDENREEKEI